MHTNPILLSFCSILYYKNLREHIRQFKLERRKIENNINLNDGFSFRIKKFTGRNNKVASASAAAGVAAVAAVDEHKPHKKYNKHIVNR